MYKSGKNWMVAGLMTTAVLAGLTLSNVNTTEVHADSTPAVTTTTAAKQNVTQEQYDAQKATVAKNSAAVADQQTVVNSASNALANVQAGNSAVSAVYSASANLESANQAWSAASANASDASAAWKSASDKLDAQAPNHYRLWNNGYSDAAQKAAETLKNDQDSLAGVIKDQAAASAAVESDAAVLDSLGSAAHQAYLDYNRVLHDANATSAQIQAARAASLDANAQRDDYGNNVYQKAVDHQTAVNLTRLGAEQKVSEDKATVANYATIQKNAEAYANVLALAKAKQSADDAFTKAGEAVTKATNLLKAVRETNLVPINEGQKGWYDNQAKNAQASLDRHANDDPANVQTLESHLKYDQQQLSDAKTKLAQDTQALKDGQAKLADLQDQLANTKDEVKKAGLKAQIKSYTDYNNGLENAITGDKATIKRYEGSISSYETQIANAKKTPAYQTWQANNEKWQKMVADGATADANYKIYLNGLANVSELQQQLNDAQAKLNSLQKEYQNSVDVLNNMVVSGQTPSDNGNTGSNAGNQGNQGNQGNAGNQNQGTTTEGNKTANAGHNSIATVKTSQKSVAATSAKAATKKNAATTAKAKKLPQTGNNSAAVVALGALSGMLGLGLAAKKREF